MRLSLAIGACALCFAVAAQAEAEPSAELQPDDLADLSIEQLAQLPVRSASKREEPLSAAPAALYVITSEEIVSSGAMSLPEALRLAPNLHVQQVDATQ
jgi:iron complex outermembrane receptor protein